ncbi:MAG: ATP cone domain-containing protein, partial [Nanoarchaeota archaeon]
MTPKASETGKTVSVTKISKIVKRDGRVVNFDPEKITTAIMKAARAVGGSDRKEAERLTAVVVEFVAKSDKIPTVEEAQDAVEKILIEEGHAKTAKAYILYRAKRAELRQAAAEAAKGSDGEKTALLDMFAHKSKLASIIGYDRIEAYKNLLFYLKDLQKKGELPVHPSDYLNANELATNIYHKKYYLKDLSNKLIEKRPEDAFSRLAAFMAAVEATPEKQQDWAARFYTALYEGYFVPGGRVIAGGGDLYRLKTLANCFVSLIAEDNIESIYQSAYECARTYS